MPISPSPNCVHFRADGRADGGTCVAGLHGGKPSYGTCAICPHKEKTLGVIALLMERTTGIPFGDIISAVATPIARALNLPCIDPATKKPRPESPCGKAIQKLNEGAPVVETLIERLKG